MSVEIRDRKFVDAVGEAVEPECIASGFGFCEGPVWDRAAQRLVFSDMKHDHMRVWTPDGRIATFRKPSNKVNGNALDRDGRLVSCEHATSRLVRQEPDGRMTVLASHYGDRALNSPNDVVVRSDGAIYFIDPTYGRVREDVGLVRSLELDFRGVFRCDPVTGRLDLLADDFEQPNGLCFSVDEQRLFVNDTMRRHIRVFDVRADGTTGGGRMWAETIGQLPGVPDGMKVDEAGNVYCTGPGGIHVFDPEGHCLGVVLLPERVTNFCWGGAVRTTLYVTGFTSLYRVSTRLRGHLSW